MSKTTPELKPFTVCYRPPFSQYGNLIKYINEPLADSNKNPIIKSITQKKS